MLRNQVKNMHNGNHVRIVVDNASDDGCQLLTYLYCQHISTPFPTQNLCHDYALNNTAFVMYRFERAQYQILIIFSGIKSLPPSFHVSNSPTSTSWSPVPSHFQLVIVGPSYLQIANKSPLSTRKYSAYPTLI